jgi:FlaA1/EpsC-like NDP-sugar epimerase/lipopolysaccharide/colanic/teichoic acid biosynthesis glycosyltransferase
MIKRIADVCGAGLGLLLLLPVLLAVALAIKLDSRGPILFTQRRIGRGGTPFKLYKFRSMFAGSEQGAVITADGDRRITRVGRLLRPSRLDELPQLVNVLKGDMSFVGPRPEAPEVVARYTAEQRHILDVRPGLTGPTQLASLDEAARLPEDIDPTEYYVRHVMPRKVELDLQYIRSRSLGNDLRILLSTPLRLGQFVLARPGLGRVPKLTRLISDLALIAAATYSAYFARFDGAIPAPDLRTLLQGLPLELAAYALAFLYLGTFRSIWRYVGVADFWQVAKAIAIGAGINAVTMHMIRWPYPRSVMVLTPAFALLLLCATRLTWRSLAPALTAAGAAADRRRVVIIGAGRTGASVARELLSTPSLAYDVVGFVDDAAHLQRATLHNLPVLGTTDELQQLALKHGLSEAVIAIPRPTLAALRRIREGCTRAGLAFKTLPSLGQLMSGDGQVRYLRKVDIAELLQRDVSSLQTEAVAGFLEGKRVMVTGAGGSIGSELCRQIVQLGAESLLMVERAENPLFTVCAELQSIGSRTKLTAALADIKHVVRMSELFARFRPQVVFHAAAYKHVPMLEAHPTEAVLNNVVGTARLAALAAQHGVDAFVFISTDKAARPNNLMGSTKRICELYLMALEDERRAPAAASRSTFRIVRFGNVLGSSGSALPVFQRQIESGGPITITDPEVSRFFMTIEEAVALVLHSATLDLKGGIAVLDMGQPVKITTLANDLVTALGLPASAVPKQFIGLRPGEKLHEVLWDQVDEVLPSPHPRIITVRPQARTLKDMDAAVRELERLAVEGHIEKLLAKVREIVPSYVAVPDGDHPGLLRIDREPKRPLAPVNGAAAAPVRKHKPLKRHA